MHGNPPRGVADRDRDPTPAERAPRADDSARGWPADGPDILTLERTRDESSSAAVVSSRAPRQRPI
jgi:hypothetical protein